MQTRAENAYMLSRCFTPAALRASHRLAVQAASTAGPLSPSAVPQESANSAQQSMA